MRKFLYEYRECLRKGDFDTLGVLLTSLIIDSGTDKYINHPDCTEQVLIERLNNKDVDGLMKTYNAIIELCGFYSRISKQVIAFSLSRRKIIGDYIYHHMYSLDRVTLKQLQDKHNDLKLVRSAKRDGFTPGFCSKEVCVDCYKVFNHCNKDIKNYSVEEEFNIKPRVVFDEEVNPNMHKAESLMSEGDFRDSVADVFLELD